jgi:prepilin-type N-terminal cleavage/methylation domain-containing protein
MFFASRLSSLVPETNTRSNGFTLIELVVVIALIGIILFVTVPNFQHLFSDETRKTSQWILLQVPKHRALAVSETRIHTLHVDMAEQRLWFSNMDMSDEELSSAMTRGLELDDSVRLLDVAYSYGDSVNSGEAQILFFPKGYSDKAIIHMEGENGDQCSFIIEPFLSKVEIIEGYADFEG